MDKAPLDPREWLDGVAGRYATLAVRWEPTGTSGPRSARRPVLLDAYIPSRLEGRAWLFSSAATAAFADAQAAVVAAEAHATYVGLRTLARQLTRSESMASSQIEGVNVPGHRALAKASIAGSAAKSPRAALAHIEAVESAYAWSASGAPFSIAAIQAIHERLARSDRWLAPHAGEIRTIQSWIGSNPNTPARAEFIPPPPDFVAPLLHDLCTFLERVDLPPVAQATLAHMQFETIHPFADGNGRVGRALLGAALIRSGLCRDVVPPISLVLIRDKQRYIDALTAYRYERDDDELYLVLAEAIQLAAEASIRLADQIRELQRAWRAQAGPLRSGSTAEALIDRFPAEPMVTVERAAELTGRSHEAARLALVGLERAGVVREITAGKRNRVWESVGVFALVDEMERELSGGVVGTAETKL